LLLQKIGRLFGICLYRSSLLRLVECIYASLAFLELMAHKR